MREEKISTQNSVHSDLIKSLSMSKDGASIVSVSLDGIL